MRKMRDTKAQRAATFAIEFKMATADRPFSLFYSPISFPFYKRIYSVYTTTWKEKKKKKERGRIKKKKKKKKTWKKRKRWTCDSRLLFFLLLLLRKKRLWTEEQLQPSFIPLLLLLLRWETWQTSLTCQSKNEWGVLLRLDTKQVERLHRSTAATCIPKSATWHRRCFIQTQPQLSTVHQSNHSLSNRFELVKPKYEPPPRWLVIISLDSVIK